jgi:hypothetical protein
MKTKLVMVWVALILGFPSLAARAAFTPLVPLAPPQIIASAEAFHGGNFEARNILDGNLRTAYASAGKGAATFLDFDFGKSVVLAGFQHIDRNDPATVKAARLLFSATPDFGAPLATVEVAHADQSGGTTQVSFTPVTARYVRWQVTAINAKGYAAVGGAEIAFFAAATPEALPSHDQLQVLPSQIMLARDGQQLQPVEFTVVHNYAEPAAATLEVAGAPSIALQLQTGQQTRELLLPAVQHDTPLAVILKIQGQVIAQTNLLRRPVRPFTVYFLPHSHHDLGYTALQPEIQLKQMSNLVTAVALARATQTNAPGARYRWNAEVLWSLDDLERTQPAQAKEVLAAIRNGWIEPQAFYANLLTGLATPEELLRHLRYAKLLEAKTGVGIECAMISDVPGLTWGTATALAAAGVKYLSDGVNYCDRIGSALVAWQDKPFWWVPASGRGRVLVWTPYMGYAASHLWGPLTAPKAQQQLLQRLRELETQGYPYDIVQMRWSGFGDNAVPDPTLIDAVKEWNATHVWPHLQIATAGEMFREFARRYGDRLPVYRGDFTPYWEDGAGSTARETALSRNAAERLVQAETLFALAPDAQFPASAFRAAWRNVLLYTEHTWGAHCSVTKPDTEFTKGQWKIKQAFALDADTQSRQLLAKAVGARGAVSNCAVDVFNTANWPRTDVVIMPKKLFADGDYVVDSAGREAPSQRLASGELALLVDKLPPFSARRYFVGPAAGTKQGAAGAGATSLTNEFLTAQLDPRTGSVSDLRLKGHAENLVDTASGSGLNDYFYLPGADLKNLQRNAAPRITVVDAGPLVATLRIKSDAPGCKQLVREVRVVSGQPRVEFVNRLDKLAVREIEGAHIGFGFRVPEGQVRLDTQFSVTRPEFDQIPGACKNWFSVSRWADVSNGKLGVTLATLDTPLIEVGGITANVPRHQPDPWQPWLQKIGPTQTLYSWILNNHWHTNYKADQDGWLEFRYAVQPHLGGFDALAAARFGVDRCQPLIVMPASGPAPAALPRLTVTPNDVIVTALKPADAGRGWVVRLYGASGRDQAVKLNWSEPAPAQLFMSNLSELPLVPAPEKIQVPAWGLVTLRAE